MLNLRQVDENSGGHLSGATHRSTIRFNVSITVGNMGESLEFGTRRFNDYLEDESDVNVAAPLSESSPSSDARS
jgi:hypothetical protein